MRSVKEWIGKDDDAKVPPRVKLRVRDAFDGRCALCGFPAILAHIDHITALINGGQNRETNLQPVCRPCHAEKTRADVKVKSKIARLAKKDMGIRKPRRITQWRRFDGRPVQATRER
jgi:5-methylcytosine-specific restriction protein A